jgi:hypothetical protein
LIYLNTGMQQVNQEKSLASSSQNRLSRLLFSLSSAQATAISEHPENAAPLLSEIVKDTRQFGLLRLEFEAELALAALEEKTGHDDTAHTQLGALKGKASSHGFTRVQHKAELLR